MWWFVAVEDSAGCISSGSSDLDSAAIFKVNFSMTRLQGEIVDLPSEHLLVEVLQEPTLPVADSGTRIASRDA